MKNNIFRKVSMFLCALIVGIFSFSFVTFFSASEMPELYDDYIFYAKFHRHYIDSNGVAFDEDYCFVSNSPIYWAIGTYANGNSYNYLSSVDGLFYSVTSSAYENGWTPFSHVSIYPMKSYYSTDEYTLVSSNGPIYTDSSCTDVYLPTTSNSSKYMPELGYVSLSGWSRSKTDSVLRFKYDTVSTTGVDLTELKPIVNGNQTDRYIVKIFGQAQFYDGLRPVNSGTSANILKNLTFSPNDTGYIDGTSSGYTEINYNLCNEVVPYEGEVGEYERADTYYLQIIDTLENGYGDYLKLEQNPHTGDFKATHVVAGSSSGGEGSLEGNYNKEIGYLKNLTDAKYCLTDSTGVQDLSSMKKVVTFDLESTTGVDLSTGEYGIRVYGQMAFVKNGTNEIVNEDFPLVHYVDYDASAGRFEYNYQELFDLVSGSAENPYNAFDTIFGQITRSDNVYFQIYNKVTGDTGGYVKSFLGMTSQGAEEPLYTTVDDKLVVDDSGYVNYDAPSSGGSGTTWEDAELNDKNIGTSNDDLEDFESTLNIFTSTLGAVPKAIGVVFSFLPSWCLGIIALSFASFGIIAVFKFIRG